MFLVLIDTRVTSYQNIIDSLTSETDYVLFDFSNDTIDDIKLRIINTYDSVGIVQHNYPFTNYKFINSLNECILYNLENNDPSLNSWTDYIQFLVWLKTERGSNYIDLMACDLWADPNWKYMINTVRSVYDVYIRASIDITGAGGDFILESDNFNTIGVYFTNNILQYKYNFYNYPLQNYAGYINYAPYALPPNNLAKISARYRTFLGTYSPTTYTDVVSVISNSGASAILRSNGNVQVIGNANFGGTMPCGVVSQSQLINIQKVVGSGNAFCALKYDGTVVCWGKVSIVTAADDVNTVVTTLAAQGANNMFINVNSVSSQLNSIVDVYANLYNAFAAITSTGKVVTWGYNIRGGNTSNATLSTFLSSGVAKIFVSVDSFTALKTNGTAVCWGGWDAGGAITYSTTYYTSSIPIVDVLTSISSVQCVYVRQNGATLDIIAYNSATPYYTLPQGVSIIKKLSNGVLGQLCFFFLLSNNTLVRIINGVYSLLTNVTDVITSGSGTTGAYGYIQSGSVVVTGLTSAGGSLTDSTYGLKSGTNLTNPVKLFSTNNSIGVLKSDNTFNWVGRVEIPYNATYYSATFPTNATETTLYNTFTSNIKSIYSSQNGYVFTKLDGNMVIFGTIGAGGSGIGSNPSNGYDSLTTRYAVKDANTNVYFEVPIEGFVALEIPYSPLVSPSAISNSTNTEVSYYVSNPDLLANVGRKYTLYNGATLLSTFYPLADTPTYVFSNVNISTNGTYSLNIKDETTITYTVTSFSLTVQGSGSGSSEYPCFRQGTKILCMNVETDEEEYIAVEKLRRGDLVKTVKHGYKAIELIGSREIANPLDIPKNSGRLYWFRKSKISGLREDLCVTGDHCILHRSISDEKRNQVLVYMGDIYVTEDHYRVPAWLDDRAETYKESGPATIWHFALENSNVYFNYGVWANGLLVESSSLYCMYKDSNMKLL